MSRLNKNLYQFLYRNTVNEKRWFPNFIFVLLSHKFSDMPVRKICLLLLFVWLCGYAFLPDDTDVKTIAGRMEVFRKKYPQEKVHLHLDKPYYSIGDTIYFKAYAVNAEKNLPSAISNVLYVDVINETNNLLQTLRFSLTDGIARGTIPLVDSLAEGSYHIRAYTTWMRNWDDAFFFDKVITVGNGFNSDLVVSSSFLFHVANGKNYDSVLIHFQSLRGTTIMGKEVSYAIAINKKETPKGKALTDDNGNIKVPLSYFNLQQNSSAALITRIKPDGKTTVTKEVNITLPSSKHGIQFFPEGGQMVAGLRARVGFKAIDANGLGAEVWGKIIDDSTGEAIPFHSAFKGIGSFQFTPQLNHTYQALAMYKNGSEEKLSLPVALSSGYVLSIDNESDDKIGIGIAVKEAVPVDKVILVAQCNNRIQYAAPLLLSDGNATISLSKRKLPTGIVQFTLFDTALQPVAERLAFINHQDALSIETFFDQKNYSKRSKTRMTLQVKDKNGDPVAGSFSLAVTDARAVVLDKTGEQTILSDLLLSSDLRGVIEDPNYYFTDINDAKAEALDNLLLTQGWRRFVWPDVLQSKLPATPFAAEKSLEIQGKVITAKGTPVTGGKVTLLSKQGAAFVTDTVTDAEGNFTFSELFFDDSHPFVVQATGEKSEKNVQVKLANFFPPPVTNSKNLFSNASAPDVMLPYLIRSLQQYDERRKNGLLQDNTHLKEVVVTTTVQTRTQEAVAPSANLNGPGNADQILTYTDLQDCHDLSTCLQGKMVGVYFKTVVDDPSSRVKTYSVKPFSTSGNGAPMAVILDGLDLNGAGSLNMRNIPVQNIQSIEVLRTGGYLSIYGFRGAGGVLVITTKRGNINYNATLPQNKKVVENTIFTTAQGYAASREFYMPDYGDATTRRNPMPDLRSTIFWKSDIVTDDNGKAIVEWYNGDSEGPCNIIIEGMAGDGKLGHAEFIYSVQP